MRQTAGVKFIFSLLAGILLQAGALAGTSDTTDNCLNYSGYGLNLTRFSREEREQGQRLVDWGVRLADGMLRVEAILESHGLTVAEIPASNLGWAAVLGDDRYRIGLYRISDKSLELLQRYTNDPDDELASRFALAEQALTLTPIDCGQSFGVLDLNLNLGQTRYLHAIRLVDRSRDIAWGMHYRFRVNDGALEHVDRLHLRCSVLTWKPDPSTVALKPRNGTAVLRESLPGMDLPTEAQLMQMHLYPDIPGYVKFGFWTQDRLFHFMEGRDSFPDRYQRIDNPCAVESTEN